MNRNNITKSACAIAAGLLVAAGLSTASAQTVIWADSFAGSASTGIDTVDTNDPGDITGVDSGAYPHAVNQEQTIDGAGNLDFPTPNDAQFTNMIDFSTSSANATTHYDFSAGTGGADILAAGGFTVSFTWTPNDTTNGSWLFFAANTEDNGYNYYYDYGNPLFPNGAGGAADGILFKNTGQSQTLQEGSNAASGSFTPNVDLSDTVSLTYSFSSWSAGSPVSLVADVNGVQDLTDSFDWNANAPGIYLDLGTYGESNKVSNLEITTNAAAVPEPGTYGMAFLGLGALFVWHRARGSRRALV